MRKKSSNEKRGEFGWPSPTTKPRPPRRGEILFSAPDAHSQAPDVLVGFVDFLVLQLGQQPIAEVLELYGGRAAAFSELFEGPWLAPDLDEADDFTDAMPIHAVLLVLDADVHASLEPRGRLRPWAVSQVTRTMLPTTAGVVAMHAIPSATALQGGFAQQVPWVPEAAGSTCASAEGSAI